MPRVKIEDDLIIRTYQVKCKHCGKPTYITHETDYCSHCKAWHCPNCLSLVRKDSVHESYGGVTYAHWGGLTVTCKKCGYNIVDT